MRTLCPDQASAVDAGAASRKDAGRRRAGSRLTMLATVVLWGALAAYEEPSLSGREPLSAPVERLPDIQLTEFTGTISSLREEHPGKAIVLNVWATWCAPCRIELPSLQRLSDELDSDHFTVVGLSVDEDPDFVSEYLRDVGITFANYLSADPVAMQARLKIESFPQTFLVRPDGTLEGRIVGLRDWVAPDQRTMVQSLWDGASAAIEYPVHGGPFQ